VAHTSNKPGIKDAENDFVQKTGGTDVLPNADKYDSEAERKKLADKEAEAAGKRAPAGATPYLIRTDAFYKGTLYRAGSIVDVIDDGKKDSAPSRDWEKLDAKVASLVRGGLIAPGSDLGGERVGQLPGDEKREQAVKRDVL